MSFSECEFALLNRIAEYDDKETRADRQNALQTLKAINKLNTQYAKEYEAAIHQVEADLEKENIYILKDTDLDENQKIFVRNYYYHKLDGFIAPVWFSAVKDLSTEPDDCIYLAVKMRKESDKSHPEFALLQLPVNLIGRFV